MDPGADERLDILAAAKEAFRSNTASSAHTCDVPASRSFSEVDSRTHRHAGTGHAQQCSRSTVLQHRAGGTCPSLSRKEPCQAGSLTSALGTQLSLPAHPHFPSREEHSTLAQREPSSGGASLGVQMHSFTTSDKG